MTIDLPAGARTTEFTLGLELALPARSPALHWRIGLVFWNRRIHLVPRLRVRREDIHLGLKPAGIIQAAGIDSDHPACALRIFSAGQTRAALGTETALVLATRGALCEMITRRTACESE